MSEQPTSKIPPKGGGPQRQRGMMPIVLVFIALLLFVLWQTNGTQAKPRTWSELLVYIRNGEVTRLEVGRSGMIATLKDGKNGKTESQVPVEYLGGRLSEEAERQLNAALEESHRKGMTVAMSGDTEPGIWSSLVPQLIFFVLILAVLWFFVFRRMGQGGGVLSFGKSRATLISKGKTSKTFKDVAGIDEAKEEVEELVEFLKNPKKFQKLGGRIPKGVLLVGPPGTGKTLLAKAIAGEADVPFYSISGSDFVEMFVGVGASRVRDLFQQAKDNSPCIIFIDEIDAVARRRGSGMSTGGHDEREQTLNAILVEMDGFASNDKVIVIAATNRVDVLDPALLRPGRFDRHIHVELPDIAGREQILQVHAAKVKLADDVDLGLTARGTPGFSGADLENLINEAALHAARFEKAGIQQDDLEYARDRVAFGREKKTGSKAMPEEERRLTAFHEAGHATIQSLLPECDPLHKVTIIPRGNFLGASMSLPLKDRRSFGRKKILGDICVAFGGRIAEEIFCDDVTTGAQQDIKVATRYARAMVYELGMSDHMGPVRYTEDQAGWQGTESVIAVGDETRRELDQEVRQLLDEQYARARRILDENRAMIARLAEALLEYETLHAEQVNIIIQGGTLEPRTPTVVVKKSEKPEPEVHRREAGGDIGPALEPKPA